MIEFTIDKYRENLATIVRRVRRNREISQRELALKAGVSLRTVASIETGSYKSLTFTTVEKVCKALDIEVKMGVSHE